MKMILALLLLFINSQLLAFDNGIYIQVKSAKAESAVKGSDGKEFYIGAKKELTLNKTHFVSGVNNNEVFSLGLTVPFAEVDNKETLILVVDGTAYRQQTAGSSHKTEAYFYFTVKGKENAQKVSKFLKAPLLLRKHPNHQLLIEYIPAKKEFYPNDQIVVTLRVTNLGKNTVSFMKGGRNRVL